MKKKNLLILMLIALVMLMLGAVSVSAATEGIFTYYVSGGKAEITDCNTSVRGDVIIPDTLGGYPVTTIGNDAFEDCSSLTSVTIPDSVTTIGNYAFYDCSGLTSVTISDGVTTIGNSAFRGCSSLKSVTIPDGVTTIGDSAFYDCSGLTKVNITDLSAWCNIEFKDPYATPLCYAKNLYLNGSMLTNLVIPDSVTSIGNYAFRGCSGLTSVTIPDSVTTIGNSAFYDCSGLTSVTIPDSVTTIGENAFYWCSGLTSVTIPNSVTTIDSCAFRDCSGLTSVTISDSVTSIGEYAFRNCSSLTSVTIPDGVTTIGERAFSSCSGLTSVSVGSGVELIPKEAFYGCSNLKSVGLSENLLYIRNDAFGNCNSIQTVFYEGSEDKWNEILFYNRNENLTDAKIIYNASKKTYKFVTNCDAVLPDITDYAVFESPIVENSTERLGGWYDNAELRGEPVSFPYYGNKTTLYAAWTDRTGESFDDAIIVKENRNYTVTTSKSGQLVYYELVPKYTCEYRFYSTGSIDTYGYLYGSKQNQLESDNDDGDGNNFRIAYNLTAGEKYYIAAKCYSGSGSFTLVIETDCVPKTETVCVTANSGEKIFITLPSYLPEDSLVILACYKDGNLVETETSLNKNETIYFIAENEFDTAKVMVWNSLLGLKPECEAENVVSLK